MGQLLLLVCLPLQFICYICLFENHKSCITFSFLFFLLSSSPSTLRPCLDGW
uniref:Uncharacterized protein n=1 Tax=Arundo donax TaxID=35708 RepID=A0A0A9HJ89_ARUDO